MDAKKFIKVILPLKLGWEPFYVLPDGVEAKIGDRARVPFAGHSYLAVVSELDATPPEGMGRIREIYGIDEAKDRIQATEIEFWRSLASYYMCSVGEVYKAAYPAVKDESVRPRKKEEAFVPMQESPMPLDAIQKSAAEQLENSFKAGKPALLSCPSADDILFEMCLRHSGSNTLWLVPEIKFNKALEKRASAILGSRLIIWGANITAAKKREAARRLRSGEPYVIIGTRSALFLPHNNLGLVLVMDEHDASYKQNSPSPRYNGRDAAILLSSIFGSRVILESSCPSFESLQNAASGKYLHADMRPAPTWTVEVVDTRAELRKNGMAGELSRRMIDLASAAKAPAFYKPSRAMFPKTEELYAQLQDVFGPDLFYTEDLLEKPLPKDTDCLVVFGADSLLGRADFRADERFVRVVSDAAVECAASLRTVCIQTKDGAHPVFEALRTASQFALLEERRSFGYPPFSRIVDVHVRDNFEDRSRRMSGALALEINALGICNVIPLGGDLLRISFPKDRFLISRKQSLLTLVEQFEKQKKYAGHIYFDVDPQ